MANSFSTRSRTSSVESYHNFIDTSSIGSNQLLNLNSTHNSLSISGLKSSLRRMFSVKSQGQLVLWYFEYFFFHLYMVLVFDYSRTFQSPGRRFGPHFIYFILNNWLISLALKPELWFKTEYVNLSLRNN